MKSPVYNVIAMDIDKIEPNNYNPNHVATPEFKLLELSIWEDGYTMPVVCYYDTEKEKYIIVDGFHRYSVLRNSKRIYERENGKLPIVIIDKDINNRMASTIRHNRARGTHDIDLMVSIVDELVNAGKSDNWIRKQLGMDKDEILRLKQIGGIASVFVNHDYSKSWETK